MDHCILYRTHGGTVNVILTDDGLDIAVFPDLDAAVAAIDKFPLLEAVPYQIVCLDEL